ncbi:MAG: hypothetical protein ACRD6X_20470, partial [Pyrinomonadaceae bacterium]
QTKAKEVLTARGGNASATRVGDVPIDYWEKRLGEIANLAAQKDAAAETVMKLVKQAGTKSQK